MLRSLAQAIVANRIHPVIDQVFPFDRAGDAFNGGLAWAICGGMSLEQAIRQACLVGALSATRLGAQPSLPNQEELNEERRCSQMEKKQFAVSAVVLTNIFHNAVASD